jgi:hypothetical protein
MGDNAMKNAGIVVTRKSPEDYTKIKHLITEYLASCGHVVHYARETPGKDDYGDLDVIYVTSPEHNMRKFIEEHFKPAKLVSNGGCMSFTVNTAVLPDKLRDFQIDFIGVRPSELESELFYRSYGDLGNIMGRVTSYYGVKFGGPGLWVVYEFQTQSGKPAQCHIDLSNDPKQICAFLGLDYSAWLDGFGGSESGMFTWIQSSRWFTTDAFRLLNADYRHRTKKRPGYNRFMEFIQVPVSDVKQAGSEDMDVTHGRWRQDEAIEFFGKQYELARGKQAQELADLRQTKFNGHMFIVCGVQPKEIGRQMRAFQQHTLGSSFQDQDWFAWLDAQPTPDSVQTLVSDFLANHQLP